MNAVSVLLYAARHEHTSVSLSAFTNGKEHHAHAYLSHRIGASAANCLTTQRQSRAEPLALRMAERQSAAAVTSRRCRIAAGDVLPAATQHRDETVMRMQLGCTHRCKCNLVG